MRRLPSEPLSEAEVRAILGDQVTVQGECWEWNGYRERDYGRLQTGHGRKLLVHRCTLSLTLGRHLEANALHRCDNPPCCRPLHLYEGTMAQNIADRDARGRTARGEAASKAKLTAPQVVSLRADRDAGLSYRRLGAKYGISSAAARSIALKIHWRHV
jgi:hypothetical protein